jgi:hypothetical protein
MDAVFLFLQCYSSQAAITHQKLAYLPDLAPSDYCLFPNLMKHLKGRKCSTTEKATLAADGWFAAQTKQFFLDGLKELGQRRHNVELREEYIRVNTCLQSHCLLFSL